MRQREVAEGRVFVPQRSVVSDRSAGEAALWLGRCYRALGRNADAVAALSRAQRLLARSPLPADATLLRLAAER